MERILQDTMDYLEKIFGDRPHIISWSGRDFLPSYLIHLYKYFQMNFLNTDFLLIISEFDKPFHITEIKKHIYQLKKHSNTSFDIVYVSKTISNYQRNQLIKEHIPFIVPHKHLYIPFLGIAFSQWFSEVKPTIKHLSPAGQSLFFELITPGAKSNTQTQLAEQLGLEKMSVSRAFQELENIEVLNKEKFGRVNTWRLTKKSWELWNTIEPYLINPILSRMYVRILDSLGAAELITAGETALAESTMLGFPVTKTYAISKKDWQKVKDKFEIVPSELYDTYCIEIWKHKVPIYQGKINPLALYLTLKDNHDERIQMSLKDLKAHYPWEMVL